jgi:hypothetical protein
MTYGVFVVTDSAGSWPVVVGPETRTWPADSKLIRCRLIARTDDPAEAERVRAETRARLDRGEA